jgi:3-isopropylmalate/(R)-2-methylmalate dehydratase large subunit
MTQSLAERILSTKIGRPVEPGEIVRVQYDLAASNDVSTPPAIARFREMGADGLADPDRVAIVPDHHVPSHTLDAQQQYTACKTFAEEHGVERLYPQSEIGVIHAVPPQDGHVRPGALGVGADSHTTTYGAPGVFAPGIRPTDLA